MNDRVYSRKTLAWLIGLSVGSFVLAIVLTAFADDLGQPLSAGANTFSNSVIGHSAVIVFLERAGIEVRVRRMERLDNIDPNVPVLAAEPRVALGAMDTTAPDFDRLFDAVRAREAPLVVVLPKWEGLPSPRNPRWLSQAAPLSPLQVDAVQDHVAVRLGVELERQQLSRDEAIDCVTAWDRSYSVALRRATLLRASDGLEPVVFCEDGWLVARHVDENDLETWVVSDPDLINNHGLGRGDNAMLMHDLIVHGMESDAIVVDETIHGFTRNTGLLAEMFSFPLILAVVHGTLLLGLVLWSGTGRLGRPRDPEPPLGSGKRVLIDNTAKLLGVVGQTAETLPRYFKQTVREVGRHYFLPADIREDRLLARLGEIGKARKVGLDLSEARREVGRLARSGNKQTDKALALAIRLHYWRRGMTRVD
jgi:hypothetical protein